MGEEEEALFARFFHVETRNAALTAALEVPLVLSAAWSLLRVVKLATRWLRIPHQQLLPRPIGHWILFLLLTLLASSMGCVRFLVDAVVTSPSRPSLEAYTGHVRYMHTFLTECARTLGVAGLGVAALSQSQSNAHTHAHTATYNLLRILLYGGGAVSLILTILTLDTSQGFLLVQAPAMVFALFYVTTDARRRPAASLLALSGMVLLTLAGKATELLPVDALPVLSPVDVSHVGMASSLPLLALSCESAVGSAPAPPPQGKNKEEPTKKRSSSK